jgi:NH3-dependent NAD+ synthetase
MSGIRIRIDDSKFRTVVLWSGGLDSTIVLHQAALATYSKSDPVIALSIRSHLGELEIVFSGFGLTIETILRSAKM